MNEKTIIDFLSLQNRWWYNKNDFPFDKTYQFKRSDYGYILHQLLPIKDAIVIYGPRGVGKSTILYELIRHLLGFPKDITKHDQEIKESNEGGVDNKRILYVTFEESSLRNLKILDVLKIYSKYILNEDISQLGKQIYVFLDEIQNIGEWGDEIKIIQDLNYPIKFMITGSSSTAMENEASKATRRLNLYSMHPLKFSDFLRYHFSDVAFDPVLKEARAIRSVLIEACNKNQPQKILDSFLRLYNNLKPWQTKIEISFQEYFIKGGYPQLLDEKDYSKCASRLRETFWLGFHKDIVLAKGIGDPVGMQELTLYISSISSCETNYTSLMKKSGATTNTGMLKKYLYHLEKNFLVNMSFKFERKPSRKSSSFKIYLQDIAVRNMLQGMLNELLLNDQNQYGLAMETLVFDHLVRLYFKIRPGMLMYYWKDSKTNKEVDFILKLNGDLMPFEVKKADSPSLSDVIGLRMFCKEKLPGIVICGKKLSLEENILFVPHWLFLMIC
ncbi:ATP-binding protein [Candidatus Woesearchaeota archaeon]|nr:ATP-binding protein [Candidatus Woesearchaeota archaeon]